MKEREILVLVNQMRTAQKKYFRTRSYADLDQSKILERQVDNALAFYFNPNNQTSIDFSPASR